MKHQKTELANVEAMRNAVIILYKNLSAKESNRMFRELVLTIDSENLASLFSTFFREDGDRLAYSIDQESLDK